MAVSPFFKLRDPRGVRKLALSREYVIDEIQAIADYLNNIAYFKISTKDAIHDSLRTIAEVVIEIRSKISEEQKTTVNLGGSSVNIGRDMAGEDIVESKK